VPWVDLATKFDGDAALAAISRVLRSGSFVGGQEVDRLEGSISRWMHRHHGVAVSSGTAALELGLSAMGIGSGDEVIVPAVSFVATIGAILRVGATPVVVDVLAEGPWIDPACAAAAVTSKTRLVIPVHLFGTAAPPLDLGIPIFDDACQAVCPGGPAFGTLTALSFYPTKVLGGIGDGGMVLTDDAELAAKLRALRNHGMGEVGHVDVAGGTNARLNEIHAAVLLTQMDKLSAEMNRRRSVAAALDGVVGTAAVPRAADGPVSVYAFRHDARDTVSSALNAAGISTSVYYPRMVHDHEAIRGRVRVVGSLSHAVRYCSTTLSVPCHGGLTGEQVGHMVRTLERVL
jgi:dTDP-4-amino-4,6-dideoxygalactose transaminase